eukprot:605370-Pelagomonas_calceolata.AAC.5
MPGKWNRNVYFEVFHAWAWARSCSAVFCFVEDDGSADAEHTEQLCTCRVTKIQCITAQAQLSRPHGHEPNQPCLQCGGFVLTTFNTTGFCFSPSRFEGGAHHLPLLAIAQGCLVQMMTLSMSYKIMCSARRSPCIYAFPGRRPICCDPAFVAIVPLIRQQVRSCMASPPTLPCCRRHAHHSLLHALYCNAGNSMALNHTLRASFLGFLTIEAELSFYDIFSAAQACSGDWALGSTRTPHLVEQLSCSLENTGLQWRRGARIYKNLWWKAGRHNPTNRSPHLMKGLLYSLPHTGLRRGAGRQDVQVSAGQWYPRPPHVQLEHGEVCSGHPGAGGLHRQLQGVVGVRGDSDHEVESCVC